MKDLPAETQVLLYNAIADYALYDIVPDFGGDGIARGFFALMRPQIDANNRRRDAGARGGRPAKSTEDEPIFDRQETDEEPNANQGETKAKPSENQTVTNAEPKEKEKAKAKENAKAKESGDRADKPRRFAKPTVEEIRAFCAERGNGIDPQRFFDYYEARGWLIGSQPMKDWQAAVRAWESREPVKPPSPAGAYAKKAGRPQIEQHARTDQDLAHLLVDLDADISDEEEKHE